MTTSEILRAAAQRVRQGWCQHRGEDRCGNVCALGALLYSTADGEGYGAASKAVRLALDIESIALWNDDPKRTQEEVAQGLEQAADWWEAQQVPAIVWTMREQVGSWWPCSMPGSCDEQ